MTSFRSRWCVYAFVVVGVCCLTTAFAEMAEGFPMDAPGRGPAVMNRLAALVDVTSPPREPVEPQLPSESRFAEPNSPVGSPSPVDRSAAESSRVLDNPGSLTSYRDRVGQVLFIKATGDATAGSIYGSGIYTDDSNLAAAAVHHGVLKAGETGIVKVTILPGQANYDAATRHGISSHAYGEWVGSYRVESVNKRQRLRLVAASRTELDDPGNLTEYARQVGETFLFRVTGTTDGSVWGTGDYTSDSDLSSAAVHAGLISVGETKVIRAEILPGRRHYHGSRRHGVPSSDWGNWGSTYRLTSVAGEAPETAEQEVIDDPGNLTRFHLPVGATLRVRVTGSIDGFVWGNEPYTYDSDLSTAAVHAGVLQIGETNIVKVTIQPVQYGFPGTERNGVTSRDWLPWDGNYRVEHDDASDAR